MTWLVFNSLLAAVLFVLGVVVFALRKYKKPWGAFYMAVVLQVILSLPAGVCQALRGFPNVANCDSTLTERIFMLPFLGWIFNAGGYSVRWIFETTVEPLEWLVGFRSAVVLSNMPYYLFLAVLQIAILAFIIGARWYRKKNFFDTVVVFIVVLFVVNSFANVCWFYVGT